MKYLPVEDYTILTRLSVDEVRNRVAENIEPKRNFRIALFSMSSTKPYEGELSNNSFTISRIINYRNSFLPIITGTFFAKDGGTEINIKMRPSILVIVFISIWLGAVGLVCIGVFIAWIIKLMHLTQNKFSPMIFIPYLMFIFGYALVTIGFKSESNRSKKFLADLFEGYEINETQTPGN